MIITDDHVYIHMPKTGGTWVKNFLQKELNGVGAIYPNNKKIGGHVPAHRIRDMFPDKSFVGTRRDPYDWYISWYHLAVRGFAEGKRNERAYYYLREYTKLYDPGLEFHDPDAHTFKAVMYGITHLYRVFPLKQDLLFSPWDTRPVNGGLYTQAMWWWYKSRGGTWLIDEWVHTENLEQEVRNLYGVTTDKEYPPQNVGEYSARHELYDDEIYSWIAAADPQTGYDVRTPRSDQ